MTSKSFTVAGCTLLYEEIAEVGFKYTHLDSKIPYVVDHQQTKFSHS